MAKLLIVSTTSSLKLAQQRENDVAVQYYPVFDVTPGEFEESRKDSVHTTGVRQPARHRDGHVAQQKLRHEVFVSLLFPFTIPLSLGNVACGRSTGCPCLLELFLPKGRMSPPRSIHARTAHWSSGL